jgi:vacuolar-type H+-ATPase subunit H
MAKAEALESSRGEATSAGAGTSSGVGAGDGAPGAAPDAGSDAAKDAAEDAALTQKVMATVRDAKAGADDSAPAQKTDESAAELARLQAENARLQAELAAKSKAPDKKDDKEDRGRPAIGVAASLRAMSVEQLGDGTPGYLIDEYTACLVKIAQAEGFVDSAVEEMAAAARAQIEEAAERARSLRFEASTLALQRKVEELEQGTKKQNAPDPAAIESHVRSVLSKPETIGNLKGPFPYLHAAIEAGAYDPLQLTSGIDFSQSWEAVNEQAERSMAMLNTAFSRTNFAAQQKPDPAPEKKEEAPAPGARVSNPSAFAPRRDEPAASSPRRGPSTLSESAERILARARERERSRA